MIRTAPKATTGRKEGWIVDDDKPRRGRPPSGKVMFTMRLDPEVIEKFKATGPGWQARINDLLKAAKV